MGIVYLARDTQLNRNVALKVTRAGLPKPGVLRMFREAQAMAQLAHRNVVTVHDVGVWNDRVFVAMEHLEGGTLARYLLAESPSWREILEKFIQAGHGLAAAHRANIVHRDFKPENVLLSAAREARVADFGLARWSSDTESPSTVDSNPSAPPSIPESVRRARLTRVGTLVGTPAYMSPEQIKGVVADHRADIWSFCAALYEALYCELPFPGRTPSEVLKYVERASVRAPPLGSEIPRWLRHALLRGLSAKPVDRFPNMETLIDALGGKRVPRFGRRTSIAIAVLAITSASIALLTLRRSVPNATQTVASTAASTDSTPHELPRTTTLLRESAPSFAESLAPLPAPTPRKAEVSATRHTSTPTKRTLTPSTVSKLEEPTPPTVATAAFREVVSGAPIIHD